MGLTPEQVISLNTAIQQRRSQEQGTARDLYEALAGERAFDLTSRQAESALETERLRRMAMELGFENLVPVTFEGKTYNLPAPEAASFSESIKRIEFAENQEERNKAINELRLKNEELALGIRRMEAELTPEINRAKRRELEYNINAAKLRYRAARDALEKAKLSGGITPSQEAAIEDRRVGLFSDAATKALYKVDSNGRVTNERIPISEAPREQLQIAIREAARYGFSIPIKLNKINMDVSPEDLASILRDLSAGYSEREIYDFRVLGKPPKGATVPR